MVLQLVLGSTNSSLDNHNQVFQRQNWFSRELSKGSKNGYLENLYFVHYRFFKWFYNQPESGFSEIQKKEQKVLQRTGNRFLK